MKVDLSGDEIDLIQESLSMKIASLKQFETHSENQQEVQECEKLLAKTYKMARDFRTKRGIEK